MADGNWYESQVWKGETPLHENKLSQEARLLEMQAKMQPNTRELHVDGQAQCDSTLGESRYDLSSLLPIFDKIDTAPDQYLDAHELKSALSYPDICTKDKEKIEALARMTNLVPGLGISKNMIEQFDLVQRDYDARQAGKSTTAFTVFWPGVVLPVETYRGMLDQIHKQSK
jgi:hypothetical protein